MDKLQAFKALGLLAIILQVSMPSASAAFPSLFNRPRLFQRQQDQAAKPPQANQNQSPNQHQNQNQQQPEPLMLNANQLAPVFGPGQFGLTGSDLLRLQSQQPLAAPHSHIRNQLPAEPSFGDFGSTNFGSFDAQPAAGYFKPTIEHLRPLASFGHMQQQQASLQPETSNLAQALADKSARLGAGHGQLVDKLEQQLDQHLDQAFGLVEQKAAASGYQANNASEKQREAAASDEGGSSGGGESGQEEGASGGEEKGGKQAEGQEQAEQSHEHGHEHHPNSFEVHHKKGGKSYQYFHQGHHHHQP